VEEFTVEGFFVFVWKHVRKNLKEKKDPLVDPPISTGKENVELMVDRENEREN
jgi:hypothetical protein